MLKFSIIIPVYNEEEILSDTIMKVDDFFSSLKENFEIIVVNDGSQDNSKSIVQELTKKIPYLKLLSRDNNRGKGYSVRQGVMTAKGEVILFTDCDLSTPLKTFNAFTLNFNQGADIVIATRKQKESKILRYQPILRRFLSSAFHRLVFLLIPLKGVSDTTCGFKAFTQVAAKKIFSRQTLSDWSFDVEILYIAQILGYKVVEVPVSWASRPKSRVNLSSAILSTLKDLLIIRLNALRGKYSILSIFLILVYTFY